MPYVNVKLIGKLTHEQKENISKGITDVLAKETGKDPKYTYVVIEEVEAENWAMPGKLFG
ncbi:MAG: 4-oxalocrotonate tautomerase family protein [Nanoarchaeota archaeon]|nr:4-oxalocrotonate tautomerase family protein [Nanoarchaeota archaeon]